MDKCCSMISIYINPCVLGGDRGGGLKLLPPVPFTPTSRPFRRGSSLFVLCRLYNVSQYCKIFSFSPGSRHFGNPASCPFSSPLPYPSCPYSPRLPPPCPPPLMCGQYLSVSHVVFINFSFLNYISYCHYCLSSSLFYFFF